MSNKDLRTVMISINPPYLDMIFSGYKKYEFRRRVLKGLDEGYPTEDVKAYIYETKNHGGLGKVIGEVTILGAYCPQYHNLNTEITSEIIKERFELVKAMYYDWCDITGTKPNPNEGWFKSKKFKQYQEQIGFYGTQVEMPNFALILSNPTRYRTPLELPNFQSQKGAIIERPPQNMYNCHLEANYYIYRQKDGLFCITTKEQSLPLLDIAKTLEEAEKKVKQLLQNSRNRNGIPLVC